MSALRVYAVCFTTSAQVLRSRCAPSLRPATLNLRPRGNASGQKHHLLLRSTTQGAVKLRYIYVTSELVAAMAKFLDLAAELKLVQPHVKVTLAHSRAKLLSSEPLPDDCKDRALDLTREAGVEVLLEHRLESTTEVDGPDNGGKPVLELTFANGHKMVADKVVMAVSRSVPSGDFLPKSALDEEGLVKITPRYGAVI